MSNCASFQVSGVRLLYTSVAQPALSLLTDHDGGVRVGSGHVNVVRLNDFGDLVVDPQNGLSLLICFGERSFELLVSRTQTLTHTY